MANLRLGRDISEIIARRRAETYAMLAKHGLTLADEPNQAEIDAAQAVLLRAGVNINEVSTEDLINMLGES